MTFLLMKRVRGGIVFGILFVTIIAWIPGHKASYLGSDSPIANGAARLHDFKKVRAHAVPFRSSNSHSFNASPVVVAANGTYICYFLMAGSLWKVLGM